MIKKLLEPELKKLVASLWDKFYSNGMANTLEIVEQMSYLIFFRKLEVTDGVNETKGKGPRQKLQINLQWAREMSMVIF